MVVGASAGTVPLGLTSLIGSPYTSPSSICRISTMTKARIGTAMIRPARPNSFPISSTPAMVMTGGKIHLPLHDYRRDEVGLDQVDSDAERRHGHGLGETEDAQGKERRHQR